MSVKKKILIMILIALIFVFIVVYPVLFQEGNPIPILRGILSLNDNTNVVEISNEPQRYLTKTEKGNSSIINLMEQGGWTFEEKLGSGYVFSKDNSKLIITSVQYTNKYTIWEIE